MYSPKAKDGRLSIYFGSNLFVKNLERSLGQFSFLRFFRRDFEAFFDRRTFAGRQRLEIAEKNNIVEEYTLCCLVTRATISPDLSVGCESPIL